jgi:hypothetical protein
MATYDHTQADITHDWYHERTNWYARAFTGTASARTVLVGDYEGDINNFGLHFQSTGIPQGATIISATLYVYVDDIGTVSANFHCEDIDNAQIYSSYSAPVVTTASTNTPTSFWTSKGDKNVDITSAVQEVVNRPGFGGNINVWCMRATSNDTQAGIRSSESGGTIRLVVEYVGMEAPPGEGGDGGSSSSGSAFFTMFLDF